MQSRGRQRQQNVSRRDRFAVDDLLAIDYADDKAGDIVFTLLVKTRHLRGLATQQHATVLTATIRHAFDDARHDFRRQLSRRDVVQKEKRARALDQNVVDAMIDEIAPDRVVHACRESDLEFGSDAIRRRDEHRLRKLGNAPSNIPPKLPISESVRWLKVRRASSLIRSVARVAASMSTPASL